jgi:hypothetical protein
MRAEQYSVGIFSAWENPAETPLHVEWTRATASEVRPFSAGSVYVNYVGDDADVPPRASFGKNYDRLVDIKTLYDPGNLFRLNFNIPPRT